MNIEKFLAKAFEENASDILIIVGMPPIMRINTELYTIQQTGNVDEQSFKEFLGQVLDKNEIESLNTNCDIDFSTTLENGMRFRVNVHYQNKSLAMALRTIKNSIPPMEKLGLPSVIETLTNLPRGLIVVTGPTGSGKSTTLASMIEYINTKRSEHIIMLEDPVEYVFNSKMSIIEQREIGTDCPTFASGLKHALRQDPDVILVGEMRDLETTSATITAAETGHLVFSTLHTVGASQTIERIIDIYPPSQQSLMRTMLANTLQAVISQTLFQRADQSGVYPCVEVMICNTAIRNCIQKNNLNEIRSIMETNRRCGMQTLDQSILEALTKGYITQEAALEKSNCPERIQKCFNKTGVKQHVPVEAAK
jgi:twitching motility protein PilT